LLKLRTVDEVLELAEVTHEVVESTLRKMSLLCRELIITKLDRADRKTRIVYNPIGALRELQESVYRKILLPRLASLPCSHGGIPGRNQLTNVKKHIGQKFIYTADIKNFFPGIHFSSVKKLFLYLGCSEQVSTLLTRICTYDYHLAPGFITSLILADHVFRPADELILRLCEHHQLIYTRFVDDLTFSGPFDFKRSGIPKTISTILRNTGFSLNEKKNQFGSLAKQATILNLRLEKGHPDVARTYYDETVKRLTDMALLANGEDFKGTYYSQDELYGRVQYVIWVNQNRRHPLMTLWKKLDWQRIEAEAKRLGILKPKKRFSVKRWRRTKKR
jgi:RNA-directed DNA polymerase